LFLFLSQELNDQEVLTLMRRFKAGEQYMYEEMCDLISHVYAKNKADSPAGASPAPVTAFVLYELSLRCHCVCDVCVVDVL
jgi:hypothetical protein